MSVIEKVRSFGIVDGTMLKILIMAFSLLYVQ
jgi:hypothetical protein